MPSYRFPSQTNANLFRDVLDSAGVDHSGDDEVVEYDDNGGDLRAEASNLDGWDVPPDNSTTGVNGFLDISAVSTRSNPPEALRGDPPAEPRRIGQPYRGGPDGSRSRLEAQMQGLPKRRSTRSQPL